MHVSTQKRLRTKVHLSAFLTLGEPGPPGHEASRSSFAGPSSRGAKPPRGNAGPVVRARVALRRESAKKTPANIFVDCPVKIERMSGWVGRCGVERESERTEGTGRSYCTTVGLNTEARRPWARRRCGADHRTTTWWLLVVCGTAITVCCVVARATTGGGCRMAKPFESISWRSQEGPFTSPVRVVTRGISNRRRVGIPRCTLSTRHHRLSARPCADIAKRLRSFERCYTVTLVSILRQCREMRSMAYPAVLVARACCLLRTVMR